MKKNAYVFAIIFAIISSISYLLPWIGDNGNYVFGYYLFIASDVGFLISILIAMVSSPEVTNDSSTINATSLQKKEPVDDMSLLNELKAKGILTSEEYDKKVLQMEENKKNAGLNEMLKEKTDSLIKPLIELKDSGLLSDEEFNLKKNEILEKEKKLFQGWIDNRPKLENLSQEMLNSFSVAQKNKIQRLIDKMKMTDTIAMLHNDIKLLDEDRWKRIIEQGVENDFKVIFKKYM
jgi:hypothetical protein